MRMPLTSLAVLMMLSLGGPCARAADDGDKETERQFDVIWGEAIRKAAASADKRDDAKLGAEILEAARTLPQESREDRRTKVYVLRRAQQLAMRDPSGYGTAEAVLNLLPKVDVELADAVARERLDLDEARFRAMTPGAERDALGGRVADELMRAGLAQFADKQLAGAKKYFDRAERVSVIAKSPRRPVAIVLLKLVDARVALARAVEELAKAHAKQQKQETARKLVELNLMELDDVGEASRFVADADDAELAKIVKLAERKVTELSAADARELGSWFFEHRKGMSISGQSVALTRARELYARYLAAAPPKDLELLRVRHRVEEIAAAVANGEAVMLPKARAAAIPVDNDTNATEVASLVQQLGETSPDVLAGFKRLQVVRVHDATELHCNGGGAKEVPGAYASRAVEGGAGQIWLWGIYEALEPGNYLVIYRMKRVSATEGDNVCFVDVCVNGNTIAQNRPPASALPPNEWRPLPVLMNLGGRTTVEYRLWSHGHTFAVDRVYVLRAAP